MRSLSFPYIAMAITDEEKFEAPKALEAVPAGKTKTELPRLKKDLRERMEEIIEGRQD